MKKLTIDVILKRFVEKHGNKYDYSLFSEYENIRQYINIICRVHGIFNQQIEMHQQGQGCPECKKETLSKIWKHDIKNIKEKFVKKHEGKYDYSLFNEYNGTGEYVDIICKEHGIFRQTSHNHLIGQGCPKCKNKNKRLSQKKFVELSKKVHNNEYDYKNVVYKTNKIKVQIKCEKHGYFLQSPNRHLLGDGCPKCKTSKGENKIMLFLSKSNINYIYQKKFNLCKDIKELPFDFYLPEHNMCIEFDGIQHFESIEFFGGDIALENTQRRDKIKNQYCFDNNITLIRIKYDENIIKKLKCTKILKHTKVP